MDIEQDLGPAQQGPGKRPGGPGIINWVTKVTLTSLGLVGLAIAVFALYGTVRLYLHGAEVSARVTGVNTRLVTTVSTSSSRPYHYRHHHHLGYSPSHRHVSSHYEKFATILFGWGGTQVSKTVQVPMSQALKIGQMVRALYLPGNLPEIRVLGGRTVNDWAVPGIFGVVGLLLFLIGALWVPPVPPVSALARAGATVFIAAVFLLGAGAAVWRAYHRSVSGTHLLTATSGQLAASVHRNVDPNLTRPLLGPGVTTSPAPAGATANRCSPMHLSGLSQPSASPGEVIDLRGQWGALTPNVVPFIYGQGDRVRLEILKWGPDDIRVEVPKGLAAGMHQVDVWCYLPPMHRGGGDCAQSSAPQCLVQREMRAGALNFMING